MLPDVLIVGHIAKDITDDGWRPGGSVFYSAVQCLRLGLKVAIVTACGPEIRPQELLPEASWHVLTDNSSTTFENRYIHGVRQQRVLARARPLSGTDIPRAWVSTPMVLLMPIFNDVEPSIIAPFATGDTVIGASVQGWLRELDGDRVRPAAPPSATAWKGLDTVFVSEEDVLDPESVASWAADAPVVALTRSKQGCTIRSEGHRSDLPAVTAREVDPTGAGDVFAAAFMVRFRETHDAVEAGRFASAAAALSIEAAGTAAIGDRAAIEARLKEPVATR